MTYDDVMQLADATRTQLAFLISKIEDQRAKRYLASADNRVYIWQRRLRLASAYQRSGYISSLQHHIGMAEYAMSRERLQQVVKG